MPRILDPGSRDSRIVTTTLGILVCLSAFVKVEPAPFDIVAVFVGACVLASSLGKLKILHSGLLGLLVVFGMISVALLPTSLSIYTGIFHTAVLAYLIILFFLLVNLLRVCEPEAYFSLFSIYLYTAVFVVILGSAVYLNLLELDVNLLKYRRLTGFFKDPNVMAAYLVPAILISVHYLLNLPWHKKILTALCLIILIFGLLMAGSRAGILNFLAAFTVYFLLHSLHRSPDVVKKGLIFLLIASIVSAVIVLSIPQLTDLLIERAAFKAYDNDRFYFQMVALLTAIDHPMGIGPGQSEVLFNYATHNTYLRIWVEMGILGLVLYLFFVVLVISTAIKLALYDQSHETYRMVAQITTASLVGIMVSGLFIDTLHWRHFWVLCAMAWSAALQQAWRSSIEYGHHTHSAG